MSLRLPESHCESHQSHNLLYYLSVLVVVEGEGEWGSTREGRLGQIYGHDRHDY